MACQFSISETAARGWFNSNHTMISQIVNYLKTDYSIKRIESRVPLQYVPRYGELRESSLAVYGIISEYMREKGIRNIVVTRNRDKELSMESVRFTVLSFGIVPSSASGFSSIEYIANDRLLDVYARHDTKAIFLVDGWYHVYRCSE